MSAASSDSVVSPARLTAPGASRAISSQSARSPSDPIKATAKPLLQKMPRHFGEAVASPLLGFPIRARRHDDEPCFADIVIVEQSIDPGGRLRRDRKGKIGRAVVEPEHRRDAEIALDRMRHRASAAECDRYRRGSCLRARPARRASWLRPEFFATAFSRRSARGLSKPIRTGAPEAKAKMALRNWPCRSSTRSYSAARSVATSRAALT